MDTETERRNLLGWEGCRYDKGRGMREVSGGLRTKKPVLITAPATTFYPDFASAFSPSDDYDDRATATRAATLPLVVRMRPVRRAVQLLRRPKHARGIDVQW